MVNNVVLIGRLGNAPELRTLDNGTKVARLSVATSRSYKDKSDQWQEITQWHNVVVWRDLAERCARLNKGAQVYVQGEIEYRKYTDKDGIERTATEIVAVTVRRLDKAPDAGAEYQQAEAARYGPMPPPPAATAPTGVNGDQYRANGYTATAPPSLPNLGDGELPF